MSERIRAFAALTAAAVMGCTGAVSGSQEGEGPAEAVEARSAPDPFAVDLNEDVSASRRQGILERRAIFEGNWLAGEVAVEAVNVEVAGLGLRAIYEQAPITPDSAPIGQVRVLEAGAPVTPVEDATACPYARDAAEVEASSVSCRFLIAQALDRAFIRGVQAIAENPLPAAFTEEAPDPTSVKVWYEDAVDFGIEHSMVLASDALREAKLCDAVPPPRDRAFNRGLDIGRAEMSDRVRTLEARTPNTECNFDWAIIEPARREASAALPALAQSNALCADYRPGTTEASVRLSQATDQFKAGIEQGLLDQSRIESARLLREWVCRRDESDDTDGGRGDPLVLDLNGDGIRVEPLSHGPVVDFGLHGRVRTEWTAPGDAFLALDRNGDGQISSDELFGDVSFTQDGLTPLDGFDALSRHDALGQGGNEDGVIDAEDEVFEFLGAWEDRDGDARVDAGELMSLAEAGVTSVNVRDESFTRTDGRSGFAADLWFEQRSVR